METIQGYNVVDLFIVLTLVIGFLLGLWKGFVRAFTALASVVLGVLAAMKYYPSVEPYLAKISKLDPQISMILSMIIVFILVQIIFVILRLLLEAAVDVTKLGWLDRSFGAIMGVLAALVVVVVIVQGLLVGVPDWSTVTKSKLVPPVNRLGLKMVEYVPGSVKDQLRQSIEKWKGTGESKPAKPGEKTDAPKAPAPGKGGSTR